MPGFPTKRFAIISVPRMKAAIRKMPSIGIRLAFVTSLRQRRYTAAIQIQFK